MVAVFRKFVSLFVTCCVTVGILVVDSPKLAMAQKIITRSFESETAAEDEPEEDPLLAQQRNGFAGIDESNFEAWIWNGNVGNPEAGRAKLKTMLELQITDIGRICSLTPAQEEKLRYAGMIDIQRFFERYMALREKFKRVRNDQNQMNNFWNELQPLQLEIQSGIYNDGSMLLRVVPRTLNQKQNAEYAEVSLERRRARIFAKLELLIVALDEAAGLTRDQRQKLVQLCESKIRMPQRFGQYDSYVVMYELSRIPEELVAEILNPKQMKTWKQSMQQYKGMEQFLRQNKLLPDDGEAPVAVPTNILLPAAEATQPESGKAE